jgi:predicted acyltransferase
MSEPTARSLAVDLLRGMTLALMIVVNMAIDDERSYGQLLHSVWHGFTLTDAVFPAFLFAVGASLALSIERQRAAGEGAFTARVLRRGALLFALGVLLTWIPFFRYDAITDALVFVDLAHVRIFGVLQRIALTYTLAALIARRFGSRGAAVAMIGSLLIYAVILPMTGDLSLENNGPRALDLFLLGPAHLYKGEGIPFDPEGLYSTLPALANVLGGYLAGRWLMNRGTNGASLQRLATAGAVALAVALLWQWQVPLNKKLWTSSYALLNLGIDTLALAALAYAADLRGWSMGRRFFEPLGGNTLAIYLLSELGNLLVSRTYVGKTNTFEWLHATFYAPWAGAKFGSLLYCLSYLLLCWTAAHALARRQIRIRL